MSIKVKLRTIRQIGVNTGLGTAFLELDKDNEVEFLDESYLNVVLAYGIVTRVVEVKKAPVVEPPKVEVKLEVKPVVEPPKAGGVA